MVEQAELLGWTPVGTTLALSWPEPQRTDIVAAWRVNGEVIALVDDGLMARTYLAADSVVNHEVLRGLAAAGAVRDPVAVINSAAGASSADWAELGDTLNDLVCGCVDPTAPRVHAIWSGRLHHDHPLIRLAACWAAPYLAGDDLLGELRAVSSDDPRVVAAAEAAALVLDRRRSDQLRA